jgi:putative hydrolase of the HAD superfamily
VGQDPVGQHPVEAVVFDYGGVLTTPMRGWIRTWLESEGIDPGSFSRTLKAWLSRDAVEGTPIHRLETGELTPDGFEELLAAELIRLDGKPVDPGGLLGRLFGGSATEEATYSLVEELRGAGVKVALLSNSWGNTYPRERIDALFNVVVISGEVGLRKPQPAVFALTAERLGVSAEACVLVDDAEPNLEGARAVGWRGILHTDPADTRAQLARLVPGLAAPIGRSTP